MNQRETLELLACDVAARPAAAPSFADVQGSIRAVRRTAGALLVEFDAAVAPTVAALVAAERLCCAGIGWDLEGAPATLLRISAAEPQLDALQQMLHG